MLTSPRQELVLIAPIGPARASLMATSKLDVVLRTPARVVRVLPLVMATYVLKTEPSEYSFSDLKRDKRSAWTGVSNPAARGHLRSMRVGDALYIYHTGNEKAIVGSAKVVKAAYADPESIKGGKFALNGKGEIAAPVIDIEYVKACTPVTLETIKADRRFADCALVTLGRLSVVPLTAAQDAALRALAGEAPR